MNASISNALVLFGATGDVAYKKIFPALQQLVRRSHLDVPLIGVAFNGWDVSRVRARIRDSLKNYGDIDEATYAKLSSLLSYVDSDYRNRSTFDRLNDALGKSRRPLFYLAIPPSMFLPVVKGLGKAPFAAASRVKEKP